MEKKYYIVEDGRQCGPFSAEELRMRNIAPSTLIWCQGMTGWEQAMSISELSDFFFGGSPDSQNPASGAQPNGYPTYPGSGQYAETPKYPAGGPYTGGQYQGGGMPSPNGGGYGIPPTNWLPWAIVATIGGLASCLGLIFGILGIVNANKANEAYAMGYTAQGDSANNTAKIMTIIGLVIDGLAILGSISIFL